MKWGKWLINRMGCLLWGHIPSREARALARIGLAPYLGEMNFQCHSCGKVLR